MQSPRPAPNRALRFAVLTARTRLGLSQAEAGELVGRDHSWVARCESGEYAITVDYVIALAHAGDARPVEVLCREVGCYLTPGNVPIPDILRDAPWAHRHAEVMAAGAEYGSAYAAAAADGRLERGEMVELASLARRNADLYGGQGELFREAAEAGRVEYVYPAAVPSGQRGRASR